MRVLVTGATGFLGNRVTAAVAEHGHDVVAMVRPSRESTEGIPYDTVRADLRVRSTLAPALAGIDAVVHLAACVVGDDDAQFASTVVGTENLLAAMAEVGVPRLVHCSTFSVYDWWRARSPMNERSPLESDNLYGRDGYAISKTWQERLVRRHAEEHSTKLTVLRPGFIWGPGLEETSGIGQPIGPLRLVFGPQRPLPLTYVENCAEAFARVLDVPITVGETYNVLDTPFVSAWKHQDRCRRELGERYWRVPVPDWLAMAGAHTATLVSKTLYRGKGKLPGILMPNRFRARFRPIRFDASKLHAAIGPFEKRSYDEAWQRISDARRAS
ncbi:MAG: NAD(P)-dependent oxidoreductase [Planctomycetota bacterium]